MKFKHYKKASLLIESIESSLMALKIELLELDDEKTNEKESNNVFKLEDIISESIDNYEPDYYEEND